VTRDQELPGVHRLAEATAEAGDLLDRLLASPLSARLLEMVEPPMRELWNRPGLERKWRRLVTVATLAALDRPRELRTHISGALRDGCTPEELAEAFLHTTFYAGIPAGVDAMAALLDITAPSSGP
jgi:alkylhydroperoxidase/carboxymuconolactone decarboxylase family protein YurZ